MYTQKELAKILRVSQSTISRAVSNSSLVTEKTRSKILEKLNEVNYQPNVFGQRLRTGRSNTVGLILPYFGYLEGYNTARITSGIGNASQE